jgi:hypothetical protein
VFVFVCCLYLAFADPLCAVARRAWQGQSTPLSYAAENGHVPVIGWLLIHGADMRIRDEARERVAWFRLCAAHGLPLLTRCVSWPAVCDRIGAHPFLTHTPKAIRTPWNIC